MQCYFNNQITVVMFNVYKCLLYIFFIKNINHENISKITEYKN